jgi:hypothetical protein
MFNTKDDIESIEFAASELLESIEEVLPCVGEYSGDSSTNMLPLATQKMLLRERDKFHTSRSNKLPQYKVIKIILALQGEYNQKKPSIEQLSTEQVKTILTVHFQQGATSRSCDGNTSINIFDQEYSLATIRKVLKLTGNKHSERKLARSMATYIHSVCEILELPGNLYNKISRVYPSSDFTTSEQAWLSDFQADNKDCPSKFRALINKSFAKNALTIGNT